MLRVKNSLIDSKGLLIQRFCQIILTLVAVEVGKIVEAISSIRMLGTEKVLVNGEGLLIQRFCQTILTLIGVEDSKIV
jgi:hypothetical protein